MIGGAIAEVLAAVGTPVEIELQLEPSLLNGHNLADLIARSSIAVLAGARAQSTVTTLVT